MGYHIFIELRKGELMESYELKLDILEPVLGNGKKAGYETRYDCPFCGEHKNKFYVVTDDDSNMPIGSYRCWVCDESGSITNLVKELYNTNFTEAKDMLSEIGIDSSGGTTMADYKRSYTSDMLTPAESLYLSLHKKELDSDKGQEEITEYKVSPFPTNMKPIKDNLRNPESYPFQKYLTKRGITLDQVILHNIHYVVSGLVRKADKVDGEDAYMTIRNSIIFITYDNEGMPIFWNSRSIDKDPAVKSLNAPARENEFGKHNTIFNLNLARREEAIVICEGVFNALTVGQEGVATFGKKVTEGQLDLIKKALYDNNKLRIYVFTDSDARNEGAKQAKELSKITDEVYLVENPYGDMDANDLGHDKSWELIKLAKKFSEGNTLSYMLGAIN